MPTNNEYWESRIRAEDAVREDTFDESIARIQRIYQGLSRDMISAVRDFVAEYVLGNSEDAYDALHTVLSKGELAHLRKVIGELSERGGRDGALARKIINATRRITRIDALTAQLDAYLNIGAASTESELRTMLDRVFRQQSILTGGALKSAGLNVSLSGQSPQQIGAVTDQRWLGESFSDRVWKNKNALVSSLRQAIPRLFLSGAEQADIARTIAQTCNTSLNAAKRLVRTEGARVATEADRRLYEDLEVRQYEYMAILDRRTSEICTQMDGRTFPINRMQVGETAPPMHPNCRSTTVPAVDISDIDEEAWLRAELDVAEKYGGVAQPKTQEQRDRGQRATVLTPSDIRARLKAIGKSDVSTADSKIVDDELAALIEARASSAVSLPKSRWGERNPAQLSRAQMVQWVDEVRNRARYDGDDLRSMPDSVRRAVHMMHYAMPRLDGNVDWNALRDMKSSVRSMMQLELSNNSRELRDTTGSDMSQKRLTERQAGAIERYTSGSGWRINAYLRGELHDSDIAALVRDVTSATRTFDLDRDMVVWRGTTSSEWQGERKTRRQRQILSASMNRDTALGYTKGKDGPTLVEIRLPRGAHAAYLGQLSRYADWEAEVMIAPSSAFTIISDTQRDGVRHVVVQYTD